MSTPGIVQRSSAGSALLLVLWTISLLSFLIVTTLMICMQDVEAVTSRQLISNARQLAQSGLALGAHPLVQAGDPVLAPQTTAQGSWEISIDMEEGRLNLNYLLNEQRRSVLEKLFVLWGMDQTNAETVVDCLMDWVDDDNVPHLKGAEKSFHSSTTNSYSPANRPFQNLDEVQSVAHWDRVVAVNPRWRESLTLWGEGKVLVDCASADVLAAATGTSLEQTRPMVATRNGPDGIALTADDIPLDGGAELLAKLGIHGEQAEAVGTLLDGVGKIKRVTSIGKAGGCSRGISVTMLRKDGRTQILEWREFVPAGGS